MRRPRLSLGASLLLAFLTGAVPARPADLRLIAPSAPGSGWDHLARALGAALTESVGGPMVEVVNRPGGSGLVGLNEFAAGPEDGDALVVGLAMLDAALLGRPPVGLDRLTPIARLTVEPYVVVVPAASPHRSAGDLSRALLAESGRTTFAGGPVGGVDHVAALLLARTTGLGAGRLNYVAFLTSADAVAAAVEERVVAGFLALSDVRPEIEAGRLRPLAVASPDRVPGLDLPTLAEAGIALDFSNWRGLMVRPGMAAEQRDRLERLVGDAHSSPGWQATLARRSWRDAYLPGEAFRDFVQAEGARLKEVLKSAGLFKHRAEDGR